MDDLIKNKVEESGLKVIDLSVFVTEDKPLFFDLSNFLFQGLILREKEYRQKLAEFDWTIYKDKTVLVFCSTDAIVPVWAYMLSVVYLSNYSNKIHYISPDKWIEKQIIEAIQNINSEDYFNARVVIKGCGDEKIPESAYFEITKKLLPVVKSILYGEPCSTVPIYKKK